MWSILGFLWISGVKQDGLLHRTQIPQSAVLQVGDIIDVTILKVEAERGRISLGMGSVGYYV